MLTRLEHEIHHLKREKDDMRMKKNQYKNRVKTFKEDLKTIV